MSYVAYPDGTPVFGGSSPLNTKAAERKASRTLGADWRERGYRVCYGEPPRPEPVEPDPCPRIRLRVFGTPIALFTDWHKSGS